MEGRASLLLLPQQRRRDARAAGGGREGLRHRHVARRHARVPEAAGEVGSEQGAGRLRRQALARVQFASALAVAERHGKAASHRSRRRRRSCWSPIRRPTARGQLDQSQSLGSPATYGTIIATWSARIDADRVGHAARQLHDRAGRSLDSRPHAGERARCRRDRPRAGTGERRDGREPAPHLPEHPAHRPVARRRLGTIRHRRAAGLRHRDGRARAQLARSRAAPRAIGVSRGRIERSDRERQSSISSRSSGPTAAGRRRRGRRIRRATRSASRRPAGRCSRCCSKSYTEARNHGITETLLDPTRCFCASELLCFCACSYRTTNGISVFSGSPLLSVRSN